MKFCHLKTNKPLLNWLCVIQSILNKDGAVIATDAELCLLIETIDRSG